MVQSVIQIKSGIMTNFHAIAKTSYMWKKIIFGILLNVVAKHGKYLASIIDDSVITCYEIIEAVARSYQRNFNEKNANCKTKTF